MGTHSPFDEDRHELPHPAAETQNSTSIDEELPRVLRRYENESLAEAWLTAQRWPDGVSCPHCGSESIARPPTSKPQPYRCRSCRTQFSARSHSVMRSSKLSISVWVRGFHVCSALSNPGAIDIRDVLPVTLKAGRNLALRIHEAWDLSRSGEANWAQSCGAIMSQPSPPRRNGRLRLPVPPPVLASPERLVEALLELPESHNWLFMNGKSFRD